jgi:2-dehydropantoate 2-reductase
MRIVVMGAGGVGAYLGAQLAAHGVDVAFIARGAQLKALREKGLVVESKFFPAHVPPQPATDDPSTVAPPDIVLFCVKLWQVETAAELIRPMVGAHTAVITVQNGVDAHERAGKILGADKIIGGVLHISATLREPGVVFHNGRLQRIIFGELDGRRSARCEAFLETCNRAKLDGVLTDNIREAIWDKFIFLVAFSGMTALLRTGIGTIRENADDFAKFRAVMEEAHAVARAKGVRFAADPVAKWLEKIPSMPHSFRASMLEDLEHGRRLELPWLSGKVAEMGRELGIPTPANQSITDALGPYADPQKRTAGSA